MEVELRKLWSPMVVLMLVLLFNAAGAAPHVPCFFIFGHWSSSTALHYRNLDHSELTGKFSDERVGNQQFSPFTASGEEILRGVNYSSPDLGGRISLNEQVLSYQKTVSDIVNILGKEETAADHLRKCVYLVGIGSNDYLNNYFMPENYSDGREEQNVDDLIEQYSEQLMILYQYGARNFSLIGESELVRKSDGNPIQSACQIFKDSLKSLVNEFNQNLLDATFSFFDISLNHPTLYVSMLRNHVIEEPQVPCYFIFGDSLADNGNNNLLYTHAKANYPPYGIDFPHGSTGRFCNGRTMVDLLAELLGFANYMPPYTFAIDEDLLRGVNYASASAGILDESGGTPGSDYSLNEQLQHHQNIVSRISTLLGSNDTAQEYLNKCLYSVGMGGNDYLNNYFSDDYNTSSLYTPEEFVEVLTEQYTQQLKTLYNHGARKIAVIGIGSIGCTPNTIADYGTNDSSCVAYINDAAKLFDMRLLSLVDEFNANLTEAQFIFVNTTGILSGLLTRDLSPLGITVLDIGCCSVGDGGLCIALETPCQNRSEYAYWDNDHPTEALNLISAIKAYNSSDLSNTYPMDIRTLANL